MRNAALYRSLRIAELLLRLVPLRLMYGLATVAGTLAFYLVPAPRRGILSNLAIALPEQSQRDRRRIARCAFCNDAKNWVDTLRISHLTHEQILASIEVHGWDRLDIGLAEGRGVIMVTMHLGNFDLVGQYLMAEGRRLTIPVEHMEPPVLFDYLVALRASQGINIVPLGRAPREMLRALRQGEIAGVAGDRDFTGHTVAVDFFGRPAQMPGGPARLARHSGAPVLVGIGIRLAAGRYAAYIPEPVEICRTDNEVADLLENTRRIVQALEPFVRRYPEQWLAFSPIWPQRTHQNDLATIGQHERAAV